MSHSIKLHYPSNVESLLKWAEQVSVQVSNKGVRYQNGHFYAQSSQGKFDNCLIMMGKRFTTEDFIKLLSLLENKTLGEILVYKPIEIAGITCVRFLFENSAQALKEALVDYSHLARLDFALHNALPNFCAAGLVLMDMDSTTIQIECIDEIAKRYGVGDEVKQVTKQAMQGRLDFNDSLRTRVEKLKDAPVTILQEIADSMPVMPGLVHFIATLKRAHWKVAIASGGFNFFANRLKNDYGFDDVIANDLEIKDDNLTGKVSGLIVDAEVKAQTLIKLAAKYHIKIEQTVAIGDGANDLVMMSSASTGIALHAAEIVQQKADISLNFVDLEGAEIILSLSSQDAW